MRSKVPEGRSGDWVLERFCVGDDPTYDAGRDTRPQFARRRPGSYSLLRRGEVQFMTDLYDEWWTQRLLLDQAARRSGQILISGLGLGLIVESLLRSPDIEASRVTVLELSKDVIRLVAPHFRDLYGDRLEIVEADVFTWTPPAGSRYSVAWHDVWPSPYGVEDEMERLRERYQPWADWIGFWPEEFQSAYAVMEDVACA